ncbi:MAG TPA: TadE/TadG family type IV pilus assembly protein [Candidatus Binataceae bacterium]|nr:TadE/TadG family type IV pilus assembly protein [Candidatus Binataceae bacterium]
MPRTRKVTHRGQAAVEFAFIAVIVMVVLLVGIQFALIGQAALAVSQASSALARFASINPGQLGPNGSVAMNSTIEQLVSPSILTNGGNDLTITIASYSQNTTTTTNSPTLGDRAVISISYNATGKIALPNPFLHITFPSSLTASESALYE